MKSWQILDVSVNYFRGKIKTTPNTKRHRASGSPYIFLFPFSYAHKKKLVKREREREREYKNNFVLLTMMMRRLQSILLLLCLTTTPSFVGGAPAEEYVVTSTMEGDALGVISNNFPGSYAVYDKTKNITLLYGQVTAAPSTSAPTPTPLQSLLPNWNFEAGTVAPWTSTNGDPNDFTIVYDTGRASNVGVATDRTSTWMGFGQDVTNLLVVGEDYTVQFAAKLLNVANGVTAPFSLTLQIRYQTYSQWKSFFYTSNGLTNQWKTFTSYFAPLQPDVAEPVQSLRLFFEGPAVGLSFAVDDVRIMPDLTTNSPSAAPSPAPTQAEYLVGADSNTELVDIPQPPQADFTPNTARSNCPHDPNPTLDDWDVLFPSLTTGQNINIPPGKHVLISESIPTTLGYITIPSDSSLVFGEDPVNGITLDVAGIAVQGSLIAGSETCRIQSAITITLHGNRPSTSQEEKYKGIAVTGTLSLHGKRYSRTWTRLARRAHAGENFLYLQDEVNWEPGQEIVLVTSALRDSRDWHENEVFLITSIDTTNTPDPKVKTVVYLDSTIQYDHIGMSEMIIFINTIELLLTFVFFVYPRFSPPSVSDRSWLAV
jgi:hypothetical protein